MKNSRCLAFSAAVAIGLTFAAPSLAQDCDAMVDEIDELLRTTDLTQEQKDQVMQLRDQGMDQNSGASTDCTTPLSEALNILKGE
jgi:Spy/CpxP family protein refolding chaperone